MKLFLHLTILGTCLAEEPASKSQLHDLSDATVVLEEPTTETKTEIQEQAQKIEEIAEQTKKIEEVAKQIKSEEPEVEKKIEE